MPRALPTTLRLITCTLVIAIAPLTTSCGSDAARDTVVRDSAGVRIVENTRPTAATIALEPRPQIDIGPAAGVQGEFIGTPISAVRQRDGTIAVAAWITTEFQLFDSTGAWRQTVGRSGEGPGEFDVLGFLFLGPGDSLITFEPAVRRVQRWTPDGQFVARDELTPPRGRPAGWLAGVFADGTLLLTTSRPDPTRTTNTTMGGTVLLQGVALEGPRWDSLLTYREARTLRHIQHPDWGYAQPLFEPVPSVAVRGSRLAFATGERFEIELRNARGELTMLLRRDAPERVVSAAERARAIEAWVGQRRDTLRTLMLPRLRSVDDRRARPAISSVHLTEDGGVWAVYGDPTLREAVRASVFDAAGRWLADVVLPSGFEIAQVDADGVLGVTVDGEGFRHIQFYRVMK